MDFYKQQREEMVRACKVTTPRPEDFDRYWEEGLTMVRALKREAVLEPAGVGLTGTECFHLTFEGVGGARVYAKYLRAENGTSDRPVLLFFHGYRRSSPSWLNLLQYIGLGYDVIAMDCRGQGGRSQDPGSVNGTTLGGHIIRGLDDPDPHHMLMQQIMLDTVWLADYASHRNGEGKTKVAVMGASQGGGLALACAALCPQVERAVIMCPFLCDYRRAWELGGTVTAYRELIDYFYLFDPRHEREEETFKKLGYVDAAHLASWIRAEVLFMTGLQDRDCPPQTQFAAYNAIAGEKQLLLYPECGHEVASDMENMALQFLLPARHDREGGK